MGPLSKGAEPKHQGFQQECDSEHSHFIVTCVWGQTCSSMPLYLKHNEIKAKQEEIVSFVTVTCQASYLRSGVPLLCPGRACDPYTVTSGVRARLDEAEAAQIQGSCWVFSQKQCWRTLSHAGRSALHPGTGASDPATSSFQGPQPHPCGDLFSLSLALCLHGTVLRSRRHECGRERQCGFSSGREGARARLDRVVPSPGASYRAMNSMLETDSGRPCRTHTGEPAFDRTGKTVCQAVGNGGWKMTR